MRANGIQDRADLVKQRIGIGQTTIYRAFDEGWAGTTNFKIVVALAAWSGTPLPDLVARLVADPTAAARKARRKAVK
jgi:hypothetical protein